MPYTKFPKLVKPKLNLKSTLLALGFSSAVVISATQLTAPSEGLVLDRPYLDSVGVATACYGSTNKNNIGFVIEDRSYSEIECTVLLAKELQEIENKITPLIKVKINDYQKAAFLDFTYNKGYANFKSSTMLGLLNSGNTRASCEQLVRWVFAGNCKQGEKDCVETSKGVWKFKLEGLVIRSKLEMKYCLGDIKMQDGK